MAALSFTLNNTANGSAARAGVIETDHGTIQTPIFMPVGTVGSVKAVTQQQLKLDVQAQIILGNTYHLYLRPGTEVLEAAGGLHRFNGWDRPILTDSGGYQVFSLAANRKIKEEGVIFQSHIDGSKHLFSPESVMDIQRSIGADIIMAFDECPPYPSTYEYAKKSMELTHRWLNRCIARLAETPDKYGYTQNLFPIVQGSTYKDLRKASCEFIASRGAVGNAIGGLSVGEPEDMMYEFTALCTEHLPLDKPRYLMGVGTPWNLLECIDLGIDMFDCVMPTRNGRNGMLFTTQGVINIRNKKWYKDFSPIDPGLPSETSQYYTKAYLRHLFVAEEILGLQIASIHNLSFYLWLVGEARKHILDNTFSSWKKEMLEILKRRL
ncbi:MAG TPA: tRNA guanosine(34) transglycosylase Tgt [Sediminibacterium sp.]|uniref:tRNA guanosine(34) transglycosylase Tgt n=1 Tax=Sediminibacterium sp. TaxID=1917865 RepID=UPI0008CB5720|nr:tRNA guanosine(34) transglycosylase Tgt [Sediminibacterium sp.]OHC84835.1 MAG: tRNA guanosine(34) transglycosylase Tgt [Sphingobacteriia bacterium RIFOXYC2_FULL_35_18]OHC88910.1 MAG: tRNA guanosine(34) transglycosylase Tgt [Sphingobacteriia bacterium RIFOXYD2_FULL_35_12]HLD53442.1 tRNA guanosine(34) transglycosylase Tgt [Sediminibacterium sp.]